jgi:hypothetical protein
MAKPIANETGVINSRGQMGYLDVAIEATQFDALKSIVESRVTDPELQKEYIYAFAVVAQNLNLTAGQFAEVLRQQGDSYDQDAFLAGYLNDNRVRNAKIGIALNLDTPDHILREIRA